MNAPHVTDAHRIESRDTAWARWRTVTPKPHGERFPFDDRGLIFDSREEAEHAADAMRRANAGEFRVVGAGPDVHPLPESENVDGMAPDTRLDGWHDFGPAERSAATTPPPVHKIRLRDGVGYFEPFHNAAKAAAHGRVAVEYATRQSPEGVDPESRCMVAAIHAHEAAHFARLALGASS